MATKADEAPPPLPSTAAAAGAEPSDPLCDPEIRAAAAEAEEEEEEPREPKRRRTCPAALENLPSAAAWGDGDGDGQGDGSVSGGGGGGDEDEAISFSFEARSFAPIETTPKFGSFNCSAASAAAAAPILEAPPPPPPPPPEEEADGVGVDAKEEKGGAEGKIGNSQGREE